MQDFQTLEPLQDGFDMFSSVEALQKANPIEPDYILGFGNKKKKVEKKIKKAEKALQKGDIKKAERKLGKALKKSPTIETQNKVDAEQSKIDAIKIPEQIPTPKAIDPVTLQDSPNVQGSGLSMPIGSGGGGADMGGGDTGAQMLDSGGAAQDTGTAPTDIKDDGTTGLSNVTITNKKFNPVIIAVFIFLVVGIIIYLSKHKKQ